MTTGVTSGAVCTDHAVRAQALRHCMHLAGWDIVHIDLDLTGTQPRVEIRLERDDGRFLLARVDSLGRAGFETWQRERSLGMSPNTSGRRPLSPQLHDVFLGRQRFNGARSMLRGLTAYVALNATGPVKLADVRRAWGWVMEAPLVSSA